MTYDFFAELKRLQDTYRAARDLPPLRKQPDTLAYYDENWDDGSDPEPRREVNHDQRLDSPQHEVGK